MGSAGIAPSGRISGAIGSLKTFPYAYAWCPTPPPVYRSSKRWNDRCTCANLRSKCYSREPSCTSFEAKLLLPPLLLLLLLLSLLQIVEICGWEKVSYLERWVQRRFSSILRSSSNNNSSSSSNFPCPVLPGSNGRGFVLLFLGAPLCSSKTLLECGLHQKDTVYIHFAVDAPPLVLPPPKPTKAAAAAADA